MKNNPFNHFGNIANDDTGNLVDQLLQENDDQKQKNTELKLKLKKMQSILEEKEKEIENKDKKNQNLEKQLNEILSDIGKGVDIKENYFKLKNENEKLKNESKIWDKYAKNDELRKLNSQLNTDLFKAKNKINQLEKNVEEIKNKKNTEFENYKKNDYNEDYIGKQLEEFYDVIVNIKSIAALETEEGWPIKWNKQRKEEIEKMKVLELLKVGILGNGNVGKSFLLSRLFDIKIPSGYSVVTEGLSLKYNENDKYIILDSAGLQTPLLSNEHYKDKDEENIRKKYEDLYKDKTQTENFIQNLIIYLSDMILIVVGKITFNEQKLINKIKKELEENDDEKENTIYIIHNLMNF